MADIKSINGNPIVVGASGIEDNAVTAAKLAQGAVTTAKLADGAVTDAKLAQSGGVLETVDDLESVIGTKAPAIINTASGAIASFDDGADDMPVKKLVASIEPVQDLHGYDSPWPGGGGKNLLNASSATTETKNGVTMTVNKQADGAVTSIIFNGTATVGAMFVIGTATLNAGTYVFAALSGGIGAVGTFYINYSGIVNVGSSDQSSTISEQKTTDVNVVIEEGVTANNVVYYPMIRPIEADATYAPYSNICPISGWTGTEIERTGKNMFPAINGAEYNDNSLYKISYVAGEYVFTVKGLNIGNDMIIIPASIDALLSTRKVIPAGTYTFSAEVTAWPHETPVDQSRIYVELIDNVTGQAVQIQNGQSATLINPSQINKVGYGRAYSMDAYSENKVKLQLELSSTATAYEPYTGNQISVTFPDEAGTVYGGTLDVTSGVLTVDRAIRDMASLDWISSYDSHYVSYSIATITKSYPNYVPNKVIFEKYKSKPSKPGGYYENEHDVVSLNANCNLYANTLEVPTGQICFELKTPVEYQLTAEEVSGIMTTLYGTNNIWADTGDVEVTYPVDTKLYIDSKITQAIANALNS